MLVGLGHIEWRQALLGADRAVGAGLHQHSCGLEVALPDRIVQGGVAVVGPLAIEFDPVGDQQGTGLGMAGIGSSMQRGCLHPWIQHAHVGTGLQQCRHDGVVPQIGRHDQRPVAIAIGLVDRCARRQQALHRGQVIGLDGCHQCGHTNRMGRGRLRNPVLRTQSSTQILPPSRSVHRVPVET